MTNKTQQQVILSILKRQGKVSQNHALSLSITRLGAIIHRLTSTGKIEVTSRGYEKTRTGKNYWYYANTI